MSIDKFLSSKAARAALKSDPVYIIGSPRSGTSLLRLMLTCHPAVIIPPEGHFFLWLEERFGGMRFPDAAEHFIDELILTKKFETWGVEKKFLQEIFREYEPKSFRDAVALVYCSYGVIKGRTEFQYWGDKNKLWKEKIDRVVKYFPNTKFIHIVRDGRDVACSFKELSAGHMHTFKYGPKLPDNINDIANHWTKNITFINDFLGMRKMDQHITVRYEDLLISPIQTLTEITDFLQLDFSDTMLNYAERNVEEKLEPEETMIWKPMLNKVLDGSNIGKFHHALTSEEVAYFEKNSGGFLQYYGYK